MYWICRRLARALQPSSHVPGGRRWLIAAFLPDGEMLAPGLLGLAGPGAVVPGHRKSWPRASLATNNNCRCLGWGIAPPLPPPAVRIATRQGKETECLLVLASAADSGVKRV
jgi:hypothetical protein